MQTSVFAQQLAIEQHQLWKNHRKIDCAMMPYYKLLNNSNATVEPNTQVGVLDGSHNGYRCLAYLHISQVEKFCISLRK
jgi:hypothetical protein